MKNLRFLLVDDEQICQIIAKKIIQSIDDEYKVTFANDGREALDKCRQAINGEADLPDFILVDLNMPILDGFEFIEAYQRLDFANKDKICIVILSSSIAHNDRDRAKNLGVHYYLDKPLTRLIILDLLSKCFAN